ncbi:uncharacterized protein LOC114867024 [Betta splendens]|uniref:C-C motif chemokine n=1 Tax=Betta splendens TaxID=158456 RepID=A0A9W2X9M2_BETSP|nr:uncharacterized protein LOC114867024 [Betta splendens]
MMKTGRILLLCILAAALVSTVVCNNGDGPDECCFSYHQHKIKKDLIQSYILTDERCAKPGVIVVTVKSRHICVDPNLSWVKGIMNHLDDELLKYTGISRSSLSTAPELSAASAPLDSLASSLEEHQVMMKTGRILLLCILAAALVSMVVCQNGRSPDECCFSYYPWRINKDLIQSYILTDERCAKPGVIVVTAKSLNICVDPNLSWVKGIMKHLDDELLNILILISVNTSPPLSQKTFTADKHQFIMKTGRILLLCILAAALVSTVVCQNGRSPDECCFSYYPWRINKDLIQSYILTDERCAKPGVIFVTAKSRHICVDPNLSWVEGIIKRLDKKDLSN